MAGEVPTATYTGGGSCAWLPDPAHRALRHRRARPRADRDHHDHRAAARPTAAARRWSTASRPSRTRSIPTQGSRPTRCPSCRFPAADLELTKVGPPDPVQPGGLGRYTFQFVNRGPSNAPDVILRDTLPDGLSFVGDTAGACSASGQAVTCALGPLDAGASGELGVDVRVDPSLAGRDGAQRRIDRGRAQRPEPRSGGSRALQQLRCRRPGRRAASGFRPEPTTPSPTTPLPTTPLPTTPAPTTPAPPGAQPRMIVEKSVRGSGARVGDELVWTVRVRNTGNAPARDVTVTDTPSARPQPGRRAAERRHLLGHGAGALQPRRSGCRGHRGGRAEDPRDPQGIRRQRGAGGVTDAVGRRRGARGARHGDASAAPMCA